MDNNKNYGVVTEQGDMGLGFNPISDSDKRLIEETERLKKETEITRKSTEGNTN